VTSALVVHDLHLAARNGRILVPILRGINLDLSQGEIHGLVGESGAGKTMLGRVILDILPPGTVITSGSVDYPVHISSPSPGRKVGDRRRSCISLIPQDPMTSLNPVKRIGKQMGEILRLAHAGSSGQIRKRAEHLLAEVKIRKPDQVLQQYPHQLSGGMRQRVLIAMAFSTEPKIIIADEPTTALDVSVQRRVLRLIRDLQKERGTTILFVTHDLGVVSKVCDRVSLMHSGMILEQGRVTDVFQAPSHRYTRSLLEAIPRYDRPREKLAPVADDLQTQLIHEAHEYDQQRRV
jgi:peptide/nickel transport system ATP-binding protein